MERKGANCLWMMGLEEIHPTDLADRKTIVEKMSSKGKGKCYGLEFGYFSEIEITTFMAGTTMSNDSSPQERRGTLMASTFESMWMRLWLKRKLRIPCLIFPFSTRKVPSR